MRIRQYIKRLATLALMVALLVPLQEAWGQVTGDRYKTSVTVVKKYYAAIEDDNNTELQKAFDGDREKTWWDAASAGPKTITIELETDQRLASVNYYGGGNEKNVDLRPSEVQVYYSSNGYEWKPVQTFSNIDRTVRDRTLTITENNRVSAKFYRLVLVPGLKDDDSYQTLAMNEITLYSQGGGEIDVPSPDVSTTNVGGKTITHKPAKWYKMRSGSNFVDTFDDEHPMFTNAGDDIQSAHTYVDTLYVKKGSPIQLLLPTLYEEKTSASNSAPKYQRWYNYETEEIFATGATEDDDIIDLLTPPNGVTAYRFQNGYVAGDGLLGGSSAMSGANFYYPENGKDKYVVACDISGYTDFTEDFSSGNGGTFGANGEYIEPTLSLRVLYVLVGIDDSWKDNAGKDHTYLNNYERLNTTTYQGGTNEATKAYLEEYNIIFPCDHISNHTDEAVAIAREAQYYRIPGDKDNDNVNVKIVDDSAGLQLIAESGDNLNDNGALTLDEGHRVISFRKSNTGANTPWSVDDGSRATILVTKTVKDTIYNIARFNLTFQKNTRLLTQHQIDRLDKHREGTELIRLDEAWFNPSYLYRTPKYLNENYILLTSRTFDYDERVMEYSYIQDGYYAFPLDWSFSSYAFFDGSTVADFNKEVVYPEWGSYGIMNDYKGHGDHNDKVKPNATLGGRTNGYFIYVDASSRPGRLATLTFDEKLCAGSELLVSAWVKSSANSDSDDAAMLFTIYGVDEDGNRTPIHSQSTGQIRKTKHFSTNSTGEYTSENGYGSDKNDWYQVFMSFVNDDPSVANFESYELRVDNNCASTVGGDYYLDEIKVYISKPTPHVSQKEFSCVNVRTKMNFYLNWRQLCERLGMDENSTDAGMHAIDFCFVDTVKYTNAIKEGKEPETALSLAIEHIGDGNDDPNGEGYDETIATIHFYEDFSKHEPYNMQGDNLAIDNKDESTGYYFFYGAGSGEDRKLSVDFYATLSPYRPYWMLIRDHTGTVSTLEEFGASINEPCGIKSDFYVEPTALIKVNGEIVKPETDFCIGQIFNFTAQVRVPTGSDDEGNDTYMLLDGVNFDWFFGTEDEFIAQNAQYNNVSLDEALTQFREIEAYRHYKSMEGVTLQGAFTQDHINIINYYLNAEGTAGGRHKRLVLCEPNLDISMLEGGLQVVMRPIKTTRPSGITEDQWANICWEYIPLELTSNHNAPVLHAGFNPVNYPTDDFNPNLRIGLAQIRKANNEYNTLRIDLRKAELVSEGATYLGLITNRTEEENRVYQQIYLTATNDPQYTNLLLQYPGAFSLPIGCLTDLFAEEYIDGSTFKDHAHYCPVKVDK